MPFHFIKKLLPHGIAPRRVQSGLFRGLWLHLDFQWGTQQWLGLYERELYATMRRLLAQCRSCVDLGAGHGELVCLCLRRHPAMRVVAVEPNADSLAYLRENVALNSHNAPQRLTVISFFAGEGPAATHRSLIDIVGDLPQPVFLKIDVDGPEAAILREATAWLRLRQAYIVVETHSLAAESAITRQLSELGYTVKFVSPAWWRRLIPERRPTAHNRWLVATPA